MSYIQSNNVVLQPAFAAGTASQTQTLSAADSGKIIILPANPATGGTQSIFLPTVAQGLRYKIFVGATMTHTVVLNCNGVASGNIINNNATAIAVVTKSAANINILAAAINGDHLDVVSDGINWYVTGISGAVGFS